MIFLIENNGYGLSTPTTEQYKCKNLSDKAIGYGIEGITINGNNVIDVYNAIKDSKKKILAGNGPILIEAITFRIRGHEEASGVKYVPKKLIDKWKKKDPIKSFESFLIKNKKINKDYIYEIESNFEKKIAPIIDKAIIAENPSSSQLNEIDNVYSQLSFNKEKASKKLSNKRFIDSIKECMFEKMKMDNSVIIMGQDIAEYGGVFKVTEGFINEFGKDRVRNTPIIESGIIGAAMGLSIEGFKPIVEMQFADFVSVGFNQIINNLAKTYYRWNQPINVTLRLPVGGNINAGPFHSQSVEAWFFHVPGLKLVYPSTPHDAKGLLLSSIDDPNPVLFFEHKALYRSLSEEIPVNNFHLELGKARIVNKGNRLSVITYGLGVHWIKDFISNNPDFSKKIEIIDLCTLLPWDKEAVIKSVQKTNKVLIINEDNLSGSISGEISSYITENAFEHLDAPIIRLGSLDTPIPFAKELENNYLVSMEEIEKSIKKLLEY